MSVTGPEDRHGRDGVAGPKVAEKLPRAGDEMLEASKTEAERLGDAHRMGG